MIKELPLISTDLFQHHDAQEEEGEKLAATIEGMHRGEGLHFSTLINMPAFKEIRLYLLQSGSEKTVENLMEKNQDLDLFCLDDVDVPM